MGQALELVGAGDEVRLAVELDDDRGPVVEVHVAPDRPLVGGLRCALGGLDGNQRKSLT